jgi:Co/Zn/Cd efflux system component
VLLHTRMFINLYVQCVICKSYLDTYARAHITQRIETYRHVINNVYFVSDPDDAIREHSRYRSSDNLLVRDGNLTEESPSPASASRSKRNINMMAAFSHILGDTLRTVAEFMAALVSTITGIDGDECDVSQPVLALIATVKLHMKRQTFLLYLPRYFNC